MLSYLTNHRAAPLSNRVTIYAALAVVSLASLTWPHSVAAQTPRRRTPTAAPTPSAPTPAPANSTPLRINCDDCPVALLIVPDMDADVTVDGLSLGTVKSEVGRVARVSPGEHRVRAASGDVVVQHVLSVEKPGQTIVDLSLRKVLAIRGLVGRYSGRIALHDPEYRWRYAYHYDLTIAPDATCTLTRRFANGPETEEVLPTLDRESPSPWVCAISPDGAVKSPAGTIVATSPTSLTLTNNHYRAGTYTVRLARQ
jgi:hypothetical protein